MDITLQFLRNNRKNYLLDGL